MITAEASARGSQVSIEDQVVVKRFPQAMLAFEVEKATRFHRAAGDAFIAPRVIDVDEQAGAIHLERVRCEENLQDRLVHPHGSVDELDDLFAGIGAALAMIHSAPVLDTDPRLLRSEDFERALAGRASDPTAELVFQHGDFGFSNLWLDGDRLVIIDASPNNYASVHPLSIDRREFDAVMLLTNLTGRTTNPKVIALLARHGRRWQDAFLGGYLDTAGVALRREVLLPIAEAHLHAFRTTYSMPRRILLKPASMRLARAADRATTRPLDDTLTETSFL